MKALAETFKAQSGEVEIKEGQQNKRRFQDSFIARRLQDLRTTDKVVKTTVVVWGGRRCLIWKYELMESTWCRHWTSQTMCHGFFLFIFWGVFLRIKGTRLARDERLVWSRSPTSQLLFLPLCLQRSDWVGFQGGCKILDGRHARLAAGQTPPVSSSLFLIRAVSFRLLKGELQPRAGLFNSRLPKPFLQGVRSAFLNWWVANQKWVTELF